MLYRKNISAGQRWARLAAGGLMVGCALVGLGTTPLGLLLAGAGLMTGLTGLVGFCPACAMYRGGK